MVKFIPEGSYQKTSQNIYVNLYCDAQKSDQSWVTASYPVCALNEPNAGLVNWNGILAPEGAPYPDKGFLPSGSYLATCKNVRVILTAKCKRIDGTWQLSTLDITSYDYEQGDIANIDGVLRNKSQKLVNAWIFLNDDVPTGTIYTTPDSCYQRLIKESVYQSADILFICFVTTTPTSATTIPAGDGSSYTIEIGAASHPGGLTNQDYMNYVIQDARKNNPNIKIAVTLDWGDGRLLSNIFSNPHYSPQQNAYNFAANLMAYLQHYDLDGFDIDWESPISEQTTQDQFKLLVNAIGTQFKQQTDKHYYLTLSPAEVGNLDATAVNNNMDFLNLQLYGGARPDDFKNAGVNQSLFAYGAKFESDRQTAEQAYEDNAEHYHYGIFTVWRLNSGNYEFEQTQQQKLYQLVFPKGDTMYGSANQYLIPEDRLCSAQKKFYLQYQNDGNLVIYDANNNPIWASNTSGKSAWRTYMQPDGNFVIYSSVWNPIWATNTSGNNNSKIVMQDDGNLVIYNAAGKPIWASKGSLVGCSQKEKGDKL